MRTFLLAATCLLAIGCGGGEKAAPTPEKQEPAVSLKTRVPGPAKLEPPDFEKRSSLRMVKNGEELRIGDSIDSALRVFREEKNAYKIAEMPPGWKDPAYTCQGWDNGTLGFGAILYDDKMCMGLYHEYKADQERLDEIVDTYERMNMETPVRVTGSRVRYWFWENEGHRMMICAVQSPKDGMNIAISLGDIKIMDIMGMSPEHAEKDRAAAEKLFQEALQKQTSQDS